MDYPRALRMECVLTEECASLPRRLTSGAAGYDLTACQIDYIEPGEKGTIKTGLKIKIPEGTQSGKQFRLRGKGMPYMRGSGNGDLYVQIETEVPVSLNKKQKELLEQFREIENEKSNPSIKQFFQKAKSFWKN